MADFRDLANSSLGILQTEPIIIVCGRMGSGKSTFIDSVTRKRDLLKFQGIRENSRTVQSSLFWNFGGHRCCFVELPSFDDDPPSDGFIISRIASFIWSWFHEIKCRYVAGILYLHDFGEPSPLENENLKKQLRFLRSLFVFGTPRDLPRIFVLTKTTHGLVEADPGRRHMVEETWTSLAEPGPDSIVLGNVGPSNIVATSLGDHLPSGDNSSETVRKLIKDRKQCLRLLSEMLSDKKRLPETTIGRQYYEEMERKRELEKARPGRSWWNRKTWSEEENRLIKEMQDWGKCKFPSDCDTTCIYHPGSRRR